MVQTIGQDFFNIIHNYCTTMSETVKILFPEGEDGAIFLLRAVLYPRAGYGIWLAGRRCFRRALNRVIAPMTTKGHGVDAAAERGQVSPQIPVAGKCPQVPCDEQNASQDDQLPPLIFGQGGAADPVGEAPHAQYEKKVGQLMGIEAFRRAMGLDGEGMFSRSQDKKEGKGKYGEKTLHNLLGWCKKWRPVCRSRLDRCIMNTKESCNFFQFGDSCNINGAAFLCLVRPLL